MWTQTVCYRDALNGLADDTATNIWSGFAAKQFNLSHLDTHSAKYINMTHSLLFPNMFGCKIPVNTVDLLTTKKTVDPFQVSSTEDIQSESSLLSKDVINGLSLISVCLFVLFLYIPSQQLWSWRDGQFT